MKIVILDKNTVTKGDISLGPIEALGTVKSYDYTGQDDVASQIGDGEIVLCNKSNITKEVMNQCEHIKYIGLFATGYNNIDLEAATENGIVVCNAPSYSTYAVAQHVFALILHITNQVAKYDQSVQQGDWVAADNFSYFSYPLVELAGMTLGIFGYGEIGQTVARIGAALGMKVIVTTRTPKNVSEVEYVSTEELFARSDILSIHCPLTDATRGLVSIERLSLMKSSAILVNTARGLIVNEHDLAKALNEGVIAGAAVDVLSREPMREDNPLRGAKNCVFTPHIAWAPTQTRERLIHIVADNIRQYIQGHPRNVVNE